MVKKGMCDADAAAQISQLGTESVLCKKANGAVQYLPLTLGNTQPPPHSGGLGH
jgi:hypothetical protein